MKTKYIGSPFIITALAVLGLLFTPPATAELETTTVAGSVTLEWNANPEPDLFGYRIYFTQDTNAWTHVKELSLMTTATIPLPLAGQWFFAATARNLAGLESEPSNIVTYTVTNRPAAVPLRLVSGTTTTTTTLTTVSNLVFVP